MSNQSSPIWTTGSSEVYHTGTWRSEIPNYINSPSPCHSACPVGGNTALWIQQIKEKDYYGAWETLTINNPYPCIAGRICHHPCEPACNRGAYDESIAICGLERFVGDLALEQDWKFPEVPISHKEKIAIIGGGPSGLAAAFHLRRMGYACIIFEAKPELGGLLRYGIPNYRLSNDILEQETQRILDLGIEVKTSSPINSREEYEKLKEKFDAIYLAMGADTPKRVPVLDYEVDYVLDGAKFLEQTNSGDVPEMGARIVVIGGGSAAMDAARSARRFDKEITVLSLETKESMPCQWEEVVEAEEEGIQFTSSFMLKSVKKMDDGLGLQCVKVNFIPGEIRGQFTLKEISNSGYVIEADTIITSIGQDPNLNVLGEMIEANGALVKVDDKHKTSAEGIFAGGDVSSMERFVTAAFGMGKEAAKSIHSYLHPEIPEEEKVPINRYIKVQKKDIPDESKNDVSVDVINKYYYDHKERKNQVVVEAAERLKNFNETQLNFSVDHALHESERCFSCGSCIFCDNCMYYCPDMAITKIDNGYEVNGDYCKGCGLCVNECPTGSIAMFEG